MSVTPQQVRTTWTWLGTGVSSIVKSAPVKKAVAEAAKTLIK